jgi:antitoxin PrlF
MASSTISSKGQITVPVAVREQFGLVPGTRVRFTATAQGVLLRKGAGAQHPVDSVFGLLGDQSGKDSLELLDEQRGPRPGGRRVRKGTSR